MHDLSTQDRFDYLKAQLTRPRFDPRWPFVGLAWVAACVCAILLFWQDTWQNNGVFLTLAAIGIFGPPAIGEIMIRNRAEKLRIPLLNELMQMDDPRATGLLLTLSEATGESYPHADRPCPPEVKQALIRLLPQLRRADARHLPVRTQTTLHMFLSDNVFTQQEGDLVLAVLLALSEVGTIAALPHVEPHARGNTKASRDPRIKEAAQRCCDVLSARAEKVKPPEMTLLRASSAPPETDTLLRADSAPARTDALLRPYCRPDKD